MVVCCLLITPCRKSMCSYNWDVNDGNTGVCGNLLGVFLFSGLGVGVGLVIVE